MAVCDLMARTSQISEQCFDAWLRISPKVFELGADSEGYIEDHSMSTEVDLEVNNASET